MLVINSININKTNNHLSSQINSLNKNRPWHMTFEIQVLPWDRHQDVAGWNWLMKSAPLSYIGKKYWCVDILDVSCLVLCLLHTNFHMHNFIHKKMDNATDKLYQIKLTIRGNRTHTFSANSTIMRWGPLDILYISWLFYSINISTLTFVNGVYIFSGSQKQGYIRTLLFGDSQKDQAQNIESSTDIH